MTEDSRTFSKGLDRGICGPVQLRGGRQLRLVFALNNNCFKDVAASR